jgi:Cu+-exporting ATPase
MAGITVDSHICYHCGTKTRRIVRYDQKDFCCDGCKSVYQLLSKNELCQYYELNNSPAANHALGFVTSADSQSNKFAFLDNEKIAERLYVFQSKTENHIVYYLPQVHCSSCVFLLENIHKLSLGVAMGELNFSKKQLKVSFDPSITTARKIAQFLTAIGYEPYFSLNDLGTEEIRSSKINGDSKQRLVRLGVAGFCFGNIMLLSFPEYFQWGNSDLDGLKPYFLLLNLLLILPVMFFSAQEFYSLAWGGLKKNYLTIDLPIVFGRILFELYYHLGPGYFDSLSGIVFFMLLGRFLQAKTYQRIAFDRDYTSYFPLSASVWKGGKTMVLPLSEIKKNDELIIHNQELIPVDSRLAHGTAQIDYSFVTGESSPVLVKTGEWLYAGGRQMSGSIRVVAEKSMSQGYLVSLWNKSSKSSLDSTSGEENDFVHRASQWFTMALFIVAVTTGIYWTFTDPTKVWTAITSVLIVACPCALLLSVTFTHGHLLTLLAKNGLYVRGASALDHWRKVTVAVFDKTGTLTVSSKPKIEYEGRDLDSNIWDGIASLAMESVHPYARKVGEWLNRPKVPIVELENALGNGVSGKIEGVLYRLGNKGFVGLSMNVSVGDKGLITEQDFPGDDVNSSNCGSEIWVAIDNKVVGRFVLTSEYRLGLQGMFTGLIQGGVRLNLLSGDKDGERLYLKHLMPLNTQFLFEQKPHQKQNFIKELKKKGESVMMVGDGLNDAGALLEADFGIAVSDDMGYFSPGCDAIVMGSSLHKLDSLWRFVKRGKRVIWWSFFISILYNIVGLGFAVTGNLNPMVAAILMPVSSISIVLFTWLSTYYGAWREHLSL